jgi:Carboxypeptidase regulatory-like domain
MLTRNCSVGFRAVVRRVSSFASAALAAVISVGPAFAGAHLPKHGPVLAQIQPAQTGISLEVVDASGAVVSKARVTIVNERTKVKVEGETNASGRLRMADLDAGLYEVSVVVPGFKTLTQSHIAVPAQIPLKLKVDVAATMGVVVVVGAPLPETKDVPVCKKLAEPPSEKPK